VLLYDVVDAYVAVPCGNDNDDNKTMTILIAITMMTMTTTTHDGLLAS
jgi:hypothetical protein